MSEATKFQEPTAVERAFNRVFGWLTARGLGPSYARQLEVRGRKSGRLYTTPVNLLEHDGELWLVAPRGRTQWVRNAEAAGEVVLRRGRTSARYRVEPVPVEERAELLERYLTRYRPMVRQCFAVDAGAPLAEFEAVAADHPVFRLVAAP